MKNYYSTYKISRIVSDDLWSKIFRFNKNVRLFRQMGVTYYYRQRKHVPIRIKEFHKIRTNYKDYTYRKNFVKRFMDRKKFKFFYGFLNNRTFKLAYLKSKSPISYSPSAYFMTRFEMLFHVILFRASFFVDTITTFQLVLHKFVFLNGYYVSTYTRMKEVGKFVSFSKFFYFPRDIKSRVQSKIYIFPPSNMLISEYIPAFLFTRHFRFPRDSKRMFKADYGSLLNSF